MRLNRCLLLSLYTAVVVSSNNTIVHSQYIFPYKQYQHACLEALFSEPDFVFFNPVWIAKNKVTQVVESNFTKPGKGQLLSERKFLFDKRGMLKNMQQRLVYLDQKYWEPLCQCTTKAVGPLTELRCYYVSHFYEKIVDTIWTRVHYYHLQPTKYVLLPDSASTLVYNYDPQGRLTAIDRNGEYEIEYQYSEAGFMEVFYYQYDNIDAVRYKMNALGQIIKRELTGVGNHNDVIYFNYNNAGFLESRKFYNKEIGRIYSTYSYQFEGS